MCCAAQSRISSLSSAELLTGPGFRPRVATEVGIRNPNIPAEINVKLGGRGGLGWKTLVAEAFISSVETIPADGAGRIILDHRTHGASIANRTHIEIQPAAQTPWTCSIKNVKEPNRGAQAAVSKVPRASPNDARGAQRARKISPANAMLASAGIEETPTETCLHANVAHHGALRAPDRRRMRADASQFLDFLEKLRVRVAQMQVVVCATICW